MNTHYTVSQLSWSTRAFHLLICASGIIICYGAFSFFQEKITQKHYGKNREHFTYMQALVFIQCAINTVVALIFKNNGKRSLDNAPNKFYLLCAISYFLAMLFSNLALEWVNYPTQVLGKSCKPIPIMLFGVFFAGKRYVWRKYFYVLLIVIGMAIFLIKNKAITHSQSSFEIGRGELFLIGSLALDGVTGAVQDKIRHNYTTEKWTMMFYMNFFSSLFLAVTILLSGEIFSFINFVTKYPYVLREMFFFAAAGATGQCFIFKTVTDFGPLTCSIVTTLRKLFSLVFSVILFNHPYSTQQMIGTGIVFFALFLDMLESRNIYKYQQKNHTKK